MLKKSKTYMRRPKIRKNIKETLGDIGTNTTMTLRQPKTNITTTS